jgi:hypothetical protein
MASPLPVRLPPFPDELLSSWITRNAAFYDVPPIVLLKHAAPGIRSLSAADNHLSDDQARALGAVFRMEADAILAMTFAQCPPAMRAMISCRPLQTCERCAPIQTTKQPILRRQLQGWRITCAACGSHLRELLQSASREEFDWPCAAALEGERLIEEEASKGTEAWVSPAAAAQILLVRRFVHWRPDRGDHRRARVLGILIPEFDRIAIAEPKNIANSGRPFLPLHLRPALMAGVAALVHAGPQMLVALRRHVLAENRRRFDALAAETAIHWLDVRGG